MRNFRKICFYMSIILIIMIFVSCQNSGESVELVENPNSIEDLSTMSSTIVEAKAIDEPIKITKKYTEEDVTNYLTLMKVEKIFRDDNNELGEEIYLYQNDFVDIDPLVKKNTKVLLFLKKIDFPDYKNVYRTIGLYNGKFKVENGKYSNSKFKDNKGLVIKENKLTTTLNSHPFNKKNINNNKEKINIEQQEENKLIKDNNLEKE